MDDPNEFYNGSDPDESSEDVKSVKDGIIKLLVKKQFNTNLMLKDVLEDDKFVEDRTKLVSISNYTSGQSSLEEFKVHAKMLEDTEDLLTYGLTQRDVDVYVDSLKGDEYLMKNYGCAVKLELDDILSRIEVGRKEKAEIESLNSSCEKPVQEVDSSTEPKLQKRLSQCSTSTQTEILCHPRETLHELNAKLFSHLDEPTVPPLEKRMKKLRKLANPKCNVQPPETVSSSSSNWDKKVWTKLAQLKTADRKPQLYIVKDGEILKLDDCDIEPKNSSDMTDDEIKDLISDAFIQKKSLEDIKKLPKFKNYNEGIPSKILYLKNLHRKVTGPVLKELFQKYDTDSEIKLKCKLMGGNMRGQAFITFSDVSQATQALQEINGIMIKDKPIIVTYGKKG